VFPFFYIFFTIADLTGERENGGDRVNNHPPRLNITPANVTQMSAGVRMGVKIKELPLSILFEKKNPDRFRVVR